MGLFKRFYVVLGVVRMTCLF